jgi:hypothetical protein
VVSATWTSLNNPVDFCSPSSQSSFPSPLLLIPELGRHGPRREQVVGDVSSRSMATPARKARTSPPSRLASARETACHGVGVTRDARLEGERGLTGVPIRERVVGRAW